MGASSTRSSSSAHASDVVHEAEGEDAGKVHEELSVPFQCPEHGTVHPDDRPWLPKLERGDLAPHHYCPECGQVEGRGGRQGLDRGGWANRLARLKELLEREGYVCTEAQRRLIFKRILADDLDDAYGFTLERQLVIVSGIASEILALPENVVLSYLEQG